MTAKTDLETVRDAADGIKKALAGPGRPRTPTGLFVAVPVEPDPPLTGRKLDASLQAGITAKLAAKPPAKP
jgi:hypothetical protein